MSQFPRPDFWLFQPAEPLRGPATLNALGSDAITCHVLVKRGKLKVFVSVTPPS
jgi:hypothetical protein